MSSSTRPFFLAGARGRLFCLYRPATRPLPGAPALLHLPAFGEEMNKSRRMVSLAARAMAENGVASLVFDPYGTGDSEGEFGDADWNGWLSDAHTAIAELRARGHERLGLWGLRTGCLLASELMPGPDLDFLLMWQPVASGEQFLNQFLRLRVAGAKLRGEEGESVKDLRAAIDAGASVEVAGYSLSSRLCAGLSASNLQRFVPPRGLEVRWQEVNAGGNPPGPVSGRIIQAWQQSGASVLAEGVVGEPFWSTQEISLAPALVERSADMVREALG